MADSALITWSSVVVILQTRTSARLVENNLNLITTLCHIVCFSLGKIGPYLWCSDLIKLNCLNSSAQRFGGKDFKYISVVSCQKGPTRHAYAWQIGPFWQDTLDLCPAMFFYLGQAAESTGDVKRRGIVSYSIDLIPLASLEPD